VLPWCRIFGTALIGVHQHQEECELSAGLSDGAFLPNSVGRMDTRPMKKRVANVFMS